MASASQLRRRGLVAAAGVSVAALTLAGCSAGDGDDSASGDSITIGTTEQITALDPAGSYDNGSFAVMNQVYPFLLNTPYGSPDVEPDIAETAEFTSENEYTVTLKEGLKFANGNELTSSDVKFTFDRQLAIADENGPSSLLYNLDSIETPDDLTVVFKLISPNDQIFPQILSSPVGPIVDEDVFSADSITSDDDIVEGKPFAGQYSISSYKVNELIQYKANPDYAGILGEAATETVNARYYTDASNLKLDVQEGNIDVAHRTLSATDIEDLRGNDNVKVVDGPGGEIRYLVFNFNTMPFGATTAEADPAKALAVRQAIADLIDRDALSEDVYKGTFTPLYSYVPEGLTGANESLKELYGADGAPDADKAAERLTAAGIQTPLDISIQYVAERYGPSSSDEYAIIKENLEESGLFTVNLQSTEWVQFSEDRVADLYPAYQLGWFPDYSDADNYLTPFFLTENFLSNHYDNQEVNDKILEQATTADPAAREALIGEIQDLVAADLSTIPYLQGAQVAVVGSDVEGAEDTLDASFKFRYAALSKG
ncbi:peptide ABC transporter substrate-binding protein [Agromyces sp. CFH 90414]|uniref:Peptide ABC transporter substrate-binding protein n=1 Tax=Agromyces agglutinans TaxID=2662258 RepID=A0A6I2F2B3_9MICO|nr:ABC transporter substrate-binding protein [Agromyces agglutinans]MRG58271.1 peptide ABC transporter substrate-binding protein [Agromyces agglutinans]